METMKDGAGYRCQVNDKTWKDVLASTFEEMQGSSENVLWSQTSSVGQSIGDYDSKW